MLVLDLCLAVQLIQKRRSGTLDPVNSTVSSARNQSSQLNRINTIAFVMSLCNCLSSIPGIMFLGSLTLTDNKGDKPTVKGSMATLIAFQVISNLLMAIKVPAIALVSKKIRREVIKAVRCQDERVRVTSAGIATKTKIKNSGKESTSSQPPQALTTFS